jgi:hypothetical protein
MINTLKLRHNASLTYPLMHKPHHDKQIKSNEPQVCQNQKWRDACKSSNQLPWDAYFDRGQIAAFREMRRLITNTKNSEPCL